MSVYIYVYMNNHMYTCHVLGVMQSVLLVND